MKRWLGPAIGGMVTAGFVYGAVASSGWSTFWFTLLAVGGVAETVALARPGKNDTLTETVHKHTDDPWPRVILAVVMAWLSWHFVADRRRTNGEEPGS